MAKETTVSNVEETWTYLLSYMNRISELGPNRPNLRKAIPYLFNSLIPNLILYDDYLQPQHSLVHYTKWEHALSMFSSDKERPVLRMYNLEHSNDPEEGKIKPKEWEKIERDAKWINRALKSDLNWNNLETGGSTYCCSFSSGPFGVEDELMYWRMYGNNGEGCSLKIIKRDELKSGDESRSLEIEAVPIYGEFRMYKVRYRHGMHSGGSKKGNVGRTATEEKEDQMVANRLKEIFYLGEKIVNNLGKDDTYLRRIVAGGLRQILYGYYHLVKDKAYDVENEWRMIKVLPHRNTIRFDTQSKNSVKRYIEGPGLNDLLITNSTMTIGPTVPNGGAARAYLEHLARKKGIEGVKVVNSDKTYRRV